MSIVLYIIMFIILLILIILSSLSSFSEMALSSCNKNRVKSINNAKSSTESEKRQSRRVIVFLDNYNQHISTIVIFNNIINVLFSVIATTFFSMLIIREAGLDEIWAPIISFIVMTPILIIFGEIVPKQLGKKLAERGIMKFSFIIKFVNSVMKPMTFILGKIIKEEDVTLLASDDEIHMAIADATKAGVTTSFEQMIIQRSLEIDNILVKNVMIPLNKVEILKDTLTKEILETTFKKTTHTRFPIIDKKGNVKYILSGKKYLVDKLRGTEKPLKNYMFDFISFHDDDNPFHIFEALRNRREKMAIILNDKENFVGIITIEDIIELLLGEIYDEDDIEKDGVYPLNETSFIIEPNVKMGYFIKEYANEINLSSNAKEKTVYKWVESINKKEPKVGTYITYKNMIIWIKMNKNKEKNIIFEIDII